MPACRSTANTLRLLPSTSILETTGFSVPTTTPSLQRIPSTSLTKEDGWALDAHRGQQREAQETYGALSIAFCAYSIWKSRPSGE